MDSLLSKMTLDEKLGQMNQLSPWNFDELAEKVRKGEVGSILNYTDPELVNKIQKVAVEESRLGIPLIVARDVIHGYKQDHFSHSSGASRNFQSRNCGKGGARSRIGSHFRRYSLDVCADD